MIEPWFGQVRDRQNKLNLMNIDDELDREIADLERKLTGGKKAGKRLLKEELEEENLFELFTCVDHLLGKGGEFEMVGSEEEDDEGVDEEDGSDEVDYGDEEEAEETEDEKDKSKKISKSKTLSADSLLTKRPPEGKENPAEPATISPKVAYFADLLFLRCKDNKNLLSHIYRLFGAIQQKKLAGECIARAVILSQTMHQPSNLENLKSLNNEDDCAEPKKTKESKLKQGQSKTDKTVHFANRQDRVRSALCALMLLPKAYLTAYLGHLSANHDSLFLWSLNGLLVLGGVGGNLLVEYLRKRPFSGEKTLAESLEREIHLIAKVVREKEPGSFKDLSTVLRERYSKDAGVLSKLNSHLEKLRNNMEIPGKPDFEFSNTLAKLLEKLIKKKRTEGVVQIKSLSELTTGSKPNAEAPLKDKKSQEVEKDLEKSDQALEKLASKLDLVTQIEKKALKIISQSTNYIDVVQGLIKLDTRGSENKEIACSVIKCLLNEKKYNKFYAEVAQKLVSLKPHFAYSFQLAIWDELKDMAESEEESVGIKNLGLFSASLICSSSLDHRLFKFLDVRPLPLPSAKVSRIVLDQMIIKMNKDVLRKLCKKISSHIDIAENLKKIASYLLKRKKESGAVEPFIEEKVIRWLEEPNAQDFADDPEI